MANEAESSDVGQSMNGPPTRRCVLLSRLVLLSWEGEGTLTYGIRNHLRRDLIQGRHRIHRGVNPFRLGLVLLDGGRDNACTQSLRENQGISWLRSGVGEHLLGMHNPGYGVAELRFLITNAVSADHGAACFHHLGKPAS